MAYDPRTGITTYDETDVATDPSVALAAEVAPSTAASSTATSLAPATRSPTSMNPNDALAWLKKRMSPAVATGPEGLGRFLGGEGDMLFSDALAAQQTGPSQEEVLYGGIGSGNIDPMLWQIAQAAGLPADFDWTPYLAAAAQAHYQQFGGPYSQTASNRAYPVAEAVRFAAESNPQLAPYAEYAAGPEFQSAGLAAMQAEDERLHARNRSRNIRSASILAMPFVGGSAGAGTGLTASEAATADIALGGAGGSAGGAALGAGAAGMFGTAAGGVLDTAAQGAVRGAVNTGIRGGNPIAGAVSGGLTGGLSQLAAPAVQNVFDSFSPDVAFAADEMADPKRMSGMLDGSFEPIQVADASGDFWGGAMSPAVPEASALFSTPAGMVEPLFGGAYSQPAMTAVQESGALVPTMMPALDATEALLPGLFGADAPLGAAAAPFAPEEQAPPAQESPAPQNTAQADRLIKLAAKLAQMGGGETMPADAPQRTEEQSDADYAQALATYVNVDAQALADMGLVPGTPEYYEYLMTQLDATVAALTGTLDVDAEDLEQQLRSKTQEELIALQRALFVRGQLGQLMGSGTYTDPFTGQAEEVITNGRRVNPGVAAYHRGLGRTIDEFATLSPIERKQAIGGFLDRDPDLYGMQGRMDAREEQAARAQAVLEDMRRRRGMFSNANPMPQFSASVTGDPELDALMGLMDYDPDAAIRAISGQ